jgi:hypothetical protein
VMHESVSSEEVACVDSHANMIMHNEQMEPVVGRRRPLPLTVHNSKCGFREWGDLRAPWLRPVSNWISFLPDTYLSRPCRLPSDAASHFAAVVVSLRSCRIRSLTSATFSVVMPVDCRPERLSSSVHVRPSLNRLHQS